VPRRPQLKDSDEGVNAGRLIGALVSAFASTTGILAAVVPLAVLLVANGGVGRARAHDPLLTRWGLAMMVVGPVTLVGTLVLASSL